LGLQRGNESGELEKQGGYGRTSKGKAERARAERFKKSRAELIRRGRVIRTKRREESMKEDQKGKRASERVAHLEE